MPEMVKTWIVFVAGLSALILGWLIGFLDSNRNSNKKIRSAALQAQIEIEKAKQAAEEASQRAAEVARTTAGNSLLRLWADPNRQAHLDVDGAQIDSPAAMLPEQRRRLIVLLNHMRPWVEGGAAAPAPLASPPSVSPAAPAETTPPPPSPLPVEPVQVGLGAGASAKSAEPPPPKSIVQQIDEVLQKRLAGTALGTRNIHLGEGVTGGVEVWVGLDRYNGIDEVPDPEVVAAIRAAIAEWEARAK